MKLCEPKESETSRWIRSTKPRGQRSYRNTALKSYVDYIDGSDYSELRKKFIKDYYKWALDFYNLKEEERNTHP